MGPSGSGQLTKMVNQICIAGLIQGLAEGLNFAVKAGLDAKLAVDVISKGAAQSWQMDNRAKTMLENRFDFGFAVDWMRKGHRHVPGRGAGLRRCHSGHRPGRSILCPGAGQGRRALRYLEPDHRFAGSSRCLDPKRSELEAGDDGTLMRSMHPLVLELRDIGGKQADADMGEFLIVATAQHLAVTIEPGDRRAVG